MNPTRHQSLFFILTGIFFLQLALIVCSSDFYGGADNISHFRIARYAWKYPPLFLDLWGKPVYTTLLFPFALFGIQAARIFSVLAGLAAIFFTIRAMRAMGEKDHLLTVVFIAFSPVYFLLMQSCLTEVLFSLVLMLSFWLFFEEKYGRAALVLSFLPFVRLEGFVLFPLFAAALVLTRQYRALPLLAAGSLFYTIAGYPHFRDWLWIIHHWPYAMDASIYGSGSPLHFVRQSPGIFGVPFLVFLIIGLIAWTVKVLRKPAWTEKAFLSWFLVAGSFLLFFAAHSYVWWKGIGGSLGLIRVIAGVIPLAAIIATLGFREIASRMQNRRTPSVLVAAVLAMQIAIPFILHDVPVRLDRPALLMRDASKYLASLNSPAKIHYFDPYLIHFLNMDPFDTTLSACGVKDRKQPSKKMGPNDVLVWDAHFGPNEGGVSLENVMRDPHLQLIKTFLPAEKFQVLGGYDYGIYIFCKTKDPGRK